MSYKIVEAGILDKIGRSNMLPGSGNHLVDMMDRFLSEPCDCGECEVCVERANAQAAAEDMRELEDAEARHNG